MVVQHNLQAMNANRMLGVTTKAAGKSTEKLSSGYRINRAADDAAGLAISEKMRKQIRGLSRASANAEDGISCVQTAEGALAEVQDMLQRMNELVVQAANGTNSVNDRQYIQDEIDQLVTEVDRVAETTKFNEIYLLKGDKASGSHKTYVTNYAFTYTKNNVSNASTNTNATSYCINYKGTNNILMVSASVLATGSNIAHTAETVGTGDDITKFMMKDANNTHNTADAGGSVTLNSSKYVAFVNVELNSNVQLADTTKTTLNGLGGQDDANGDKEYDLAYDTTSSVVKASRDLYVYDTATKTVTHVKQGNDMTKYLNNDNTMKNEFRLVDMIAGDTSGGASDGTSKRVLDTITNNTPFKWTDKILETDQKLQKLYDANGQEVSGMALNKFFNENGLYTGGLYTTAQARAIDEVFANNTSPEYQAIAANTNNPTPALITDFINQSSTEVADDLEFDIHVGADSARTNKIEAAITNLSAAGLGVDKLKSTNIGIVDTTGNNATDAIDIIADALQKVSTQRSALGAVQNRLEHTIKNLDNVVENTQSAESQIRDTDMATEMVKHSNTNVLQQAGQSMLAQANQANQGVLSLLQ